MCLQKDPKKRPTMEEAGGPSEGLTTTSRLKCTKAKAKFFRHQTYEKKTRNLEPVEALADPKTSIQGACFHGCVFALVQCYCMQIDRVEWRTTEAPCWFSGESPWCHREPGFFRSTPSMEHWFFRSSRDVFPTASETQSVWFACWCSVGSDPIGLRGFLSHPFVHSPLGVAFCGYFSRTEFGATPAGRASFLRPPFCLLGGLEETPKADSQHGSPSTQTHGAGAMSEVCDRNAKFFRTADARSPGACSRLVAGAPIRLRAAPCFFFSSSSRGLTFFFPPR